MTFRDRLNHIFNERDIDIKELAKKLEIAPHTIDRWLDGRSLPGEKVQQFVLDALEETND